MRLPLFIFACVVLFVDAVSNDDDVQGAMESDWLLIGSLIRINME